MSILIKNVEIFDTNSSFHQQVKNVLVENGKIVRVTDSTIEATEIVDGTNLKLSPGWVDMRVSFNDPGYEYKEDITSGCQSAAQGGITEVLCLPNTKPVVQTKDTLSYIKMKSAPQLVQVHSTGALTHDCDGKEMTEMEDMHHAGALAFTDGHHPIWHAGILVKSLQYLKKINGLIINKSFDTYLSKDGQMHEGINSTLLGFKAIPSISEYLSIQRDLELLKYAGTGRLHFSCISTKESVDLIRQAKAEGLNVTADVAAHQLVFDDSVGSTFDANFKVMPPFRESADIEALKVGLKDGTIDVIVSDHTPQDIESKDLEFNYAEFGVIGLETLFATINTHSDLSLEQLTDKLTNQPRSILGLENVTIEEGSVANLTLFDIEKEWTVNKEDIISQSKNSPFIGNTLKGKAIAVFNKNQYQIIE